MENNNGSRGSLAGLFNPRSVAIVGASATAHKWGNLLARGALQGRDFRSVYLINSRGGTVYDQPVFCSLRELPETPELVVLCMPAQALEATVEEALLVGSRYIVSITAGLGEKGIEGKERERLLVEHIHQSGGRLLGPNCMGVFDAESALYTTIKQFAPGSIGVISQSGNLCIELEIMAQRRGLGFSRVVSLGNQADIEAEEVLEEMARHERTKIIILYLESFRSGRRFVEAARLAREAGKPVVLITVGSSEASARAAKSHTGSLAGETEIVDAACRAGGVIRVLSPEQAIQVAQAMLCPGRPPGRRIGVIADGGGHGAVAAELASAHGLLVPEFSDCLSHKISEVLPATATSTNPVDFAGGESDLNTYERVISLVLNSGEVDAVLFSGFFGGFGRDSEDLHELEMDVAGRLAQACFHSQIPLMVHTMNHDSEPADRLRENLVPVFWSADGAVRALSMAVQWWDPVHDLQRLPEPAPPIHDSGYWASRQLMIEAGIPFPGARLVSAPEEVVAATSGLRYPLVAKALGLLHKTDSGGVVLGISDEQELIDAAKDLFDRLSPPAITIEEMAPVSDGVELIIGSKWDSDFGPVILIGIGGIYAEVLRDFATALAPLDPSTAEGLIRSLRMSPILDGVRGQPSMNVSRAAEIASLFSHLAAKHPEIREMEMNPVLVTPDSAIALDSRVVLRSSERVMVSITSAVAQLAPDPIPS